MELIDSIARIPDTFIIVKGHTRGDAIDEHKFSHLRDYPNLVLSADVDSVPLINWAQITINFGSSIGIEAIVHGKITINPLFLHSNETVFDDSEVSFNTHSINDSVTLIKKIKNGEVLSMSSTGKEAFLRSEVYADDEPFDVAERYADLVSGKN